MRIPTITFTINEIQNQLSDNAIGYLKVGLELYSRYKEENNHNLLVHEVRYQTIIGNLAIAIELMLKATIAKKCFPFLYQGLPKELQLMLFYPAQSHDRTHIYINELKSFSDKFKTIEFNEAVGLFYNIYPDNENEFQPHLKFLSQIRNNSVHAYIPLHEKFQVDRVMYIALRLFKFLSDNKVLACSPFDSISRSMIFLDQYESSRNEIVSGKIKKAKERAKKINSPLIKEQPADKWGCLNSSCIICGSSAFFYGRTEFSPERDEDETGEYFVLFLEFIASLYRCDACGLQLDDTKEIELVSLDIVHDRSYDIDEWLDSQGLKADNFDMEHFNQ